MQIEIGTIAEGTVTGLTSFGAFVKLPTQETGMVHISEVSNGFVKDINEHLSVGQKVKVKVLGDNNGKISLSIKQALPKEEQKPERDNDRQQRGGYNRSRKPNVWQGTGPKTDSANLSFEEMMNNFKKASDEKMSTLRRSADSRYSNPVNRKSGK